MCFTNVATIAEKKNIRSSHNKFEDFEQAYVTCNLHLNFTSDNIPFIDWSLWRCIYGEVHDKLQGKVALNEYVNEQHASSFFSNTC